MSIIGGFTLVCTYLDSTNTTFHILHGIFHMSHSTKSVYGSIHISLHESNLVITIG